MLFNLKELLASFPDKPYEVGCCLGCCLIDNKIEKQTRRLPWDQGGAEEIWLCRDHWKEAELECPSIGKFFDIK